MNKKISVLLVPVIFGVLGWSESGHAEEKVENGSEETTMSTIDKTYIEKEFHETIERIQMLSFDELLKGYGGRSVIKNGLKEENHEDVSMYDVDNYQLDDSYQEIQKNAAVFVESLINGFDEYNLMTNTVATVKDELSENLDDLLLTKTYLNRWYGIDINSKTLADQLFFMTNQENKSTQFVKHFSMSIKKQSQLLDSAETANTYKKVIMPFNSSYKEVNELVEAFIEKQTGRVDYDQWFRERFQGRILDGYSQYEVLNQTVWEKLAHGPNQEVNKRGKYFLPMLMLKQTDQLFILNAPFLLGFSSTIGYKNQGDANYNVRRAASQLTEFVENMYRTGGLSQEELAKPEKRVVMAFDAETKNHKFNYSDETHQLANGLMLATHNLAPLGRGAGAIGPKEAVYFIRSNFGSENGGTFAHELFHTLDDIIMPTAMREGKVETIASQVHNWLKSGQGLEFVMYEAEEFQSKSKSPTANKPGRFQQPKDLQAYFGGYVGLVYGLNQVVAEYVLSLPVAEQVGYIRKWDEATDTIKICTADEISKMELTNVEDLIDSDIGIFDKSIPDGPVPTNKPYTSSFYTRDSHYFVAENDIPINHYNVQFADELLSLEEGTGWEKASEFFSNNNNTTENWSDLTVLQNMFHDPKYNFKQFRKELFKRYGTPVAKSGLKYDTFAELKQLFAENPQNFRKVKNDLYAKYMKNTKEFRESIYVEENQISDPEVDPVKATDAYLTGQGIFGKTIIALVGDKEIGKGKVTEDGSFKLTIEPQKMNTKIVVKQLDGDKISQGVEVTVEESIELVSQLLAEEISKQLLIPVTHFFSRQEIDQINTLKFNRIFLDDQHLTDIGKLNKLKELKLTSTAICDLSFVEHLTDLKALYLDDNLIAAVDPLKNLKNLEYLSFQRNKSISDITPLGTLTNLKKLWLAGNQIKKVDSLATLKKLEKLDLSANQIADISPVEGTVTEAQKQIVTTEIQPVKHRQLTIFNQIQRPSEESFGSFISLPDHNGTYDPIKNQFNWTNLNEENLPRSLSYEFSFEESPVYSGKVVIPIEEAAKTSAYNIYKLGYWRSYGFILEGQAGIEGQSFIQKEDVTKTIELVNTKKKLVEATVKATNTNWYNPANYDGYQAILTNEMIGKLTEGNYRLQVKILLKDGESVTENLISEQSFVYDFIGDYQDTITNAGNHSVDEKVIRFTEGFDQILLNVSESKDQANILNSRVNAKGDNVIDFWIASGKYDFRKDHTKNLVIKDTNGKEVYNKKAPTWDIKKTFKKNVKAEWQKSGVQALIPKVYRGTSFTKEIEVQPTDTQEELTVEIPQEFKK